MKTPARQYKRGKPTLLTQLVGRAARARRLRMNVQQNDFAASIGISKGRLSEIELNQRVHLTIAVLEPVAARLGITLSQLIREAEAMRVEIHEPWEKPPRRARSKEDVRCSRAIGKALRARRHASGRKLADVAADVGIDLAHVCEHERGLLAPALTTLFAYARALRCSTHDLMRDAEEILASKRRKAA